MASQDECEAAVRTLVALLDNVDPETRSKYVLERTVSLRITDLDVTWSGRLGDEGLSDLRDDDDERAQVRLSVGSDDLIALVEGRMAVPTAVATGRVRVQASPFDLLRLRSFL